MSWAVSALKAIGAKGLAILLAVAAALSWLAYKRHQWKREGWKDAITEMKEAKEEARDEARAIEVRARDAGAGAARDFLRNRKAAHRRR